MMALITMFAMVTCPSRNPTVDIKVHGEGLQFEHQGHIGRHWTCRLLSMVPPMVWSPLALAPGH